jgi:cytochrome c oxidase subunit IV
MRRCLAPSQPSRPGRRKEGDGVERNAHIFGWLLFILSACSYLASNVRIGDWLGIVGSVFFLLACFVFLVPLLWTGRND